jgi:hypothetical protein
MDDIFIVAHLAEPSQAEEMLSRHVSDANLVCIDCKLLVSDLISFAATWLVTKYREALNKIFQWSFFGNLSLRTP